MGQPYFYVPLLGQEHIAPCGNTNFFLLMGGGGSVPFGYHIKSEAKIILSLQVVNPHNFLYSGLHNLTYCWNQKAGSTSVSHVFSTIINASNFFSTNNLYYRYLYSHDIPGNHHPPCQDYLMSCLQDLQLPSLLLWTPASCSQWWGTPWTGWSLPTGWSWSWSCTSDYLRLCRDKILSNPGSYAGRQVAMALNHTNPHNPVSWQDFISYLLHTPVQEYDTHWYPQYLQCAPCKVQ